MKPVFQRIIDSENGDCFKCCIASILELEYDDVPNFKAQATAIGKHHADDFYIPWLHSKGLVLLNHHTGLLACNIPDVYCIVDVDSQKFPGKTHCVVGQFQTKGNKGRLIIVHDPNSNNVSYDENARFLACRFIVPHKPKIKQ